MSLSARIGLYAVIVAFSLVGCTYQRTVVLPPTDLPEQIYTPPKRDYYGKSSVGVFRFAEPPYAPGMGTAAAEALYEALLSNGVFASVTPELDVSDIRTESLIDIARTRKYSLIITGDLLYYFEGSLHQASRVDERIRVVDVAKNKTLCYAEAMEIGPSAPYTDYIVAEGRGAPAPTTRWLLKRNAEKFCRMLLNIPPEEFPALAVVQADEEAEARRLAAEKESLKAQKALEEQFLWQERLREEDTARKEREEMAERKIFLNENVHFECDKSRLLPEAKEILRRKAKWLMAYPSISVIIEGHCDERGTSEFNMALGARRAQSAKSYLVELGIAPERLATVSHGRERPLDPGHNETAWAKNRRVQCLIK